MKTTNHILHLLSQRGKRLTATRKAIINAALSLPPHFTLSDLSDRLAPYAVHRATLFRTMALLEEFGVLRRLPGDRNGPVRFESVREKPRHNHLLCRVCGRVTEFQNHTIARELARLAPTHGFVPTDTQIIIRGVCAACSSDERIM